MLIFIIIILLIEGYFRIFSNFKYYSPRIFNESDYLPWTLLPNSEDYHYGYYGEFKVKIMINKYGFRDHDFSYGNNKKRNIVFLGDSFAFGFGVENTEAYMKVLEKKLLNKDLRLINCGFACGYSPDLYYLFLKKELQHLNPELVVIGIYDGNDISDIQYNEWLDNNLETLKIKSSKFYIDSNHRLRYSPQYGLGGIFFAGNNKVDYLSKIKIIIRDNSYLLNFIVSRLRMFNFKNTNRFDFNIPETKISESTAKQRFEISLVKNKLLLEELKIKYLFILIPSKEDFVNATNEFKYIDSYLKNNNYNYLNLLSEFKRRNIDMNKIYYKYDGHWNRYGHEAVALVLFDYFKNLYPTHF